MKPTERDLMVARAVRDACVDAYIVNRDSFTDDNVTALLESLPEPAEQERGRVIGIFVGELQKLHEKTVLDCGDNSCLFATRRGGMRTNGGCRCIERLLDAAVAREREEHPVLCDVLMIADEMAADIDCEKTPGGLEHMGDVREWFRDAAAEIRARSAKGV